MATTFYAYDHVPDPKGPAPWIHLGDRCPTGCAVHECIHCGTLRTHDTAKAQGPCMCDGNFPEVAMLVNEAL